MEKNNNIINNIFKKLEENGYENLSEEEKDIYLKKINDLFNDSNNLAEIEENYIGEFKEMIFNLEKDLETNKDKLIEIYFRIIKNNYYNIISKELYEEHKTFFIIKKKSLSDIEKFYYNKFVEIFSKNTSMFKNFIKNDLKRLYSRKFYWDTLAYNLNENQFNIDENIKEIFQIPEVKENLRYLLTCEYVKEHKEIIGDLIEKIVKNILDDDIKINLFDNFAYTFSKEIFEKLVAKIQLSIEEKDILLSNIINKRIREFNCLKYFELMQIIFPNNNTKILCSICSLKNKDKNKENLELLKSLLDNEIISINNINTKDKDGNTALDFAIENSNYEMAFFLARRFKDKNLLLKDENKGEILKSAALFSDFNLFSNLYKPEFLDPESKLYVPGLFEYACIGGNKEIIETLINSLKIENLKSEDISKLFDNLYKSKNPNINTINLLTNLINKNKINNPKNIFNVKKSRGQGSNQTTIYRSFEYDNNKNVTEITDFVYSKIIYKEIDENNKEIEKEQTLLLYKINYNDSDEKIITYYDKEGKELISAKVNNNNEINFIINEHLKDDKNYLNSLQTKIDEILNDNYKSMDSFDITLSYLSYVPIKLEENDVIIKSECDTIESIMDVINDSLDKQNKDKTFICDLGIDNHCVQVLISNGNTTIINTGYNFNYIGKEIKKKFQEKYNKKIEVEQFVSSLQNAGNCVLCSKITVRLLLSQYKIHKNVYNNLSKDLNRLQKLSKDLIENSEKTDEDKIKYVNELNNKDFKKYYDLLKIVAKASVETYNKNKQNFEKKINEPFKKLLIIFNKVGKEKNIYDKALDDIIVLDENKKNTLNM